MISLLVLTFLLGHAANGQKKFLYQCIRGETCKRCGVTSTCDAASFEYPTLDECKVDCFQTQEDLYQCAFASGVCVKCKRSGRGFPTEQVCLTAFSNFDICKNSTSCGGMACCDYVEGLCRPESHPVCQLSGAASFSNFLSCNPVCFKRRFYCPTISRTSCRPCTDVVPSGQLCPANCEKFKTKDECDRSISPMYFCDSKSRCKKCDGKSKYHCAGRATFSSQSICENTCFPPPKIYCQDCDKTCKTCGGRGKIPCPGDNLNTYPTIVDCLELCNTVSQFYCDRCDYQCKSCGAQNGKPLHNCPFDQLYGSLSQCSSNCREPTKYWCDKSSYQCRSCPQTTCPQRDLYDTNKACDDFCFPDTMQTCQLLSNGKKTCSQCGGRQKISCGPGKVFHTAPSCDKHCFEDTEYYCDDSSRTCKECKGSARITCESKPFSEESVCIKNCAEKYFCEFDKCRRCGGETEIPCPFDSFSGRTDCLKTCEDKFACSRINRTCVHCGPTTTTKCPTSTRLFSIDLGVKFCNDFCERINTIKDANQLVSTTAATNEDEGER